MNTQSTPVFLDHKRQPKSQDLANRLGLALCCELPENAQQWLEWITDKKTAETKLALCSLDKGPVSIDFLGGKKAHRRQFGGGKGQPLVRAMGTQETGLPTILDATAGMGGDSFVLATQGFSVHMLERSALVSALLEDALNRARNTEEALSEELSSAIHNLSLTNADSASYLLEQQPDVDVIYMDPMYPEKKKKAAAKKEMQALQTLVGPDLDSNQLLEAALQTAKLRVVVKRPKGAEPVGNAFAIQPNTQISSPNTRYDVYVIKALKASGQLS